MEIFVEVDYTEPDIRWTMVGTAGGNDPDTGDIYRGFGRFGRMGRMGKNGEEWGQGKNGVRA